MEKREQPPGNEFMTSIEDDKRLQARGAQKHSQASRLFHT
jgi:hypothetical protein